MSLLWVLISCWMLRTITGNGHHSSLLLLLPCMYIYTPYTIIMWRQRCQASSRQASTLVTPWCSVLDWEYFAVSFETYFCSLHFKYTFVLFWHSFCFVWRCCWLHGLHSICEENLQKYQMRLNFCTLLIEAVSKLCLAAVWCGVILDSD